MDNTLLTTAQKALTEAAVISKQIQMTLDTNGVLAKKDKSPVTIADFLSQAVICHYLKSRIPSIPVVAEERSDLLKQPENHSLIDQILYYIKKNSSIKENVNPDYLFQIIDYGNQTPTDQFWTLDPIDGTKGFLRHDQYAIALALVVKGEVQLAILACPNLRLKKMASNKGYLLWAEKGKGSFIRSLDKDNRKKIEISKRKRKDTIQVLQSLESSHSDMKLQAELITAMGIKGPVISMDSQAKYGLVATGESEIYIRTPHPQSLYYKEKIWDHAAGSLIVQEAGGIVSDIYGLPLDFTCGKKLEKNTGILATTPFFHEKIVDWLSMHMKNPKSQ